MIQNTQKTRQPAVLFDLDGTLIDSLSVTFAGFNAGIVSQGGRPHTPDEIIAYFGPGEREIFAQIIGRDRAMAAYKAYCDYIETEMTRCPLHEGVSELLDALKRNDVPVAIVTGRCSLTARTMLEHHGLYDRFITVIANDNVKESKPSPEGLLIALQRVGREGRESLYVGDNWVDMKAANGSGCRAIGALWDAGADRAALEQHRPYGFATEPGQILGFWRELTT